MTTPDPFHLRARGTQPLFNLRSTVNFEYFVSFLALSYLAVRSVPCTDAGLVVLGRLCSNTGVGPCMDRECFLRVLEINKGAGPQSSNASAQDPIHEGKSPTSLLYTCLVLWTIILASVDTMARFKRREGWRFQVTLGSDRNRSGDCACDGCMSFSRHSSGSWSVRMKAHGLLRPRLHLDYVWITAVRLDSHVSSSRDECFLRVRSVRIFTFCGRAGFIVFHGL